MTCFFLLPLLLPRFLAKLRFSIKDMDGSDNPTSAMDAFVCVISGAIGGLIIGLVTEYYTSHSYAPVREVRNAAGTLRSTSVVDGWVIRYVALFLVEYKYF